MRSFVSVVAGILLASCPVCGPAAAQGESGEAPPTSGPPTEAPLPPLPAPQGPGGAALASAQDGAGRLAALEAGLDALGKKLTVTTGDEQFRLRIFGTLQATAIFSTARPLAPGTPFLLAPDSPFGLETRTVDVHARASSIGAALVGPKIGEWQTSGLFLAFFYNDNILEDRYGILPFQIWADVKNEDWRFAFGLQRDIFNPIDPTLLTFAALFGSGNTGNYRGQFRVERFFEPADDVHLTIQAGLGDPIATLFSDQLRLSEDNGWPNVEGRIALGIGPLVGEGLFARRPFEVGISGVVGQIRTTPGDTGRRVVADVYGLGVDARWAITEQFGFAGEVFAGQGLGTYNGGVLQNVNSVDLRGLRSSGAWGEVYYFLCPNLHTHLGLGIDDPIDRDAAPAQIVRNETYFGNVIWDVTKFLRVGFEATWRETSYSVLRDSEGATFQTVAQLSF